MGRCNVNKLRLGCGCVKRHAHRAPLTRAINLAGMVTLHGTIPAVSYLTLHALGCVSCCACAVYALHVERLGQQVWPGAWVIGSMQAGVHQDAM